MSKRERHAMPPEARRAVEMLRSWVVVVRADIVRMMTGDSSGRCLYCGDMQSNTRVFAHEELVVQKIQILSQDNASWSYPIVLCIALFIQSASVMSKIVPKDHVKLI